MSALILLATVLVSPLVTDRPASASYGSPHGVMLYGTHCQQSGPSITQIQTWIKNTGVQQVRMSMLDDACVDPADLVPIVYPNGPVTTIVMTAGTTEHQLYWNDIQNNFERKHGVFYSNQYWSYADVYKKFTGATFYIEFGNEPDLGYDNTSSYYRFQAVAAYKELWNNACSHITTAWKTKYSRLK